MIQHDFVEFDGLLNGHKTFYHDESFHTYRDNEFFFLLATIEIVSNRYEIDYYVVVFFGIISIVTIE